MLVMTECRLYELRKEMTNPRVSRAMLGVEADVSMISVRNAELGHVLPKTARAIVRALNKMRRKQGLSSNWTVESVGIRLGKEQ